MAMNADLPIQNNIPLRQYNTFGVEATAAAFLTVDDVSQLLRIADDSALMCLPRLVLGGGSNILLKEDFPGLVLHMALKGIHIVRQDSEATAIRVSAGENWHQFVLWTLAQGFGGLENLSLIPGSVGAAPIQNIGAYGVEVKDFIESITLFDFETRSLMTLPQADCQFAYRDSIFKHRLRDRAVILDVTFALPTSWQANSRYAELAEELSKRALVMPTALDISNAVIAIRQRKLPDPAIIGNAGSFFKNPIVSGQLRDALLSQFPHIVNYPQADGSFKLAAGWLIDQCGWKGRSLGPAGVYEKQALVLVNHGGATGQDIWRLAQAIQADVFSRFQVRLEAEPILVAQ